MLPNPAPENTMKLSVSYELSLSLWQLPQSPSKAASIMRYVMVSQSMTSLENVHWVTSVYTIKNSPGIPACRITRFRLLHISPASFSQSASPEQRNRLIKE